MEGLAIIDDQATETMVDPKVVKDLGVEEADQIPYAHCTTTIHGTSSLNHCHIIKNLIIETLSGNEKFMLKNAITQEMPNALRDVPTPEEVSTIPGLSHLASEFPSKKGLAYLTSVGQRLHTGPTSQSNNGKW